MEQVRSDRDQEQEEEWEEAAAEAEWKATVRGPAREGTVCALNAS
ncbi:MAG: hypothetical protein U9R44_07995 [Candidatus Omnitrophota bacterium]|nr:hypothetical protein [Candidatus Omnitrophota bacterium]